MPLNRKFAFWVSLFLSIYFKLWFSYQKTDSTFQSVLIIKKTDVFTLLLFKFSCLIIQIFLVWLMCGEPYSCVCGPCSEDVQLPFREPIPRMFHQMKVLSDLLDFSMSFQKEHWGLWKCFCRYFWCRYRVQQHRAVGNCLVVKSSPVQFLKPIQVISYSCYSKD